MFLAGLSMSLSREVAGHFLVTSDVKWGPKVQAAASKAFADAIAVVDEDKGAEYTSLKGAWADNETLFKDVPLGGITYSVVSGEKDLSGKEVASHYGLADEERKISLNGAPVATLSNLFKIKGELSQPVADDLAAFVVDWRDTNNTKEGAKQPEDCSYLSPPAQCKDTGFEAVEELLWIPGMTNALYQNIKDELTVHGTGKTNINTATAASLMAHGLSAEGASKIVEWRKAGNVFEKISHITGRSYEFALEPLDQVALAKAASTGLFGLSSDTFEGVVRAESGGKVRGQIRFVISRSDGLKLWQE